MGNIKWYYIAGIIFGIGEVLGSMLIGVKLYIKKLNAKSES